MSNIQIERSPPVPSEGPSPQSSPTLTTLAICGIVIAALYIAREVFIPLALAVLLSFALGPLVHFLRRYGAGRIPSVIAAALLASFVVFGIGALIGGQVAQLAENLPQYQTNILDKIHTLQGATSSKGFFGRTSVMLKHFATELSDAPNPTDGKQSNAAARLAARLAQQSQPLPVEIRRPDPTPFQIVQSIVGPLLQPLATTGIVVVFVIFFLVQREDLRDRFIRLAGARDLRRTTNALDDAGSRLSRYLLTQTGINACFGVLIGTGLFLIGVPNALLWGIMAMLLRFVPYIGPVIAAVFPGTLAVAIDPGWTMVLWTAALFLVVEPAMGQIVEPLLFGRTTGLSPVAVVIAAAFWTWLWGPVGLFLSTPLTLCLVVVGRHVERLKFLDVALGDKPALTPAESFYQRILADDPDEAAYQAEELLKKMTLAEYYDEVALKGLALAQIDVNRGGLDHARRVRLKSAIDIIIDNLSDHEDVLPAHQAGRSPERRLEPRLEAPAEAPGWSAVMCVAGRGSLDEAAATMLAQLLIRAGIEAHVVPSTAVSAGSIFNLDVSETKLVCLSYLEAGGLTSARYLVRRFRRKSPAVKILIGFWTLSDQDLERLDALSQTGADFIATSQAEAVRKIVRAAAQDNTLAPRPGPPAEVAQPAAQ